MLQYNRLTHSIRAGLYGGMAAGAVALTACGGGGASDGGSGTFSLGVTDAPVDEAQSVYVEFSSVTLVPADGEGDTDEGGDDASDDSADGDGDGADGDDGTGLVTIELEENRRIDLLEQQNGKRELLIDNESLPAGDYEQIRLGIVQDGTQIVIDGKPFELKVPSGLETGLKINTDGLDLADGEALDLTIDFDLRKSVVRRGNAETNNGFLLKPVLRLVETASTGEIAVEATTEYVNDRCADNDTQAAYIYEGADVVPDDVDTSNDTDVDPVTTVSLELDNETGSFVGTAGFLESGTYTAAFTCDPENDDPESDQDNDDSAGSVFFEDAENIDVEAGETSQYTLDVSGS